MQLHLLLPLFSSFAFVGAMLFIKRATDFRIGIWRTTFIANFLTAVLFLALIPLGGEPIDIGKLWQPLIIAALFVGGQGLTFLALEKGDVSIATPTMGVKTICVAWLSVTLIGVELPWQLWVSAVMTFAAIGLLNISRIPGSKASAEPSGPREASQVGKTIVIAFLAALSYSLFDVLIQKWAANWGVGHFLPIIMGMSALLSIGFVPLFKEPISAIPRAAWPWLSGGALLMGLQAISLVSSVAIFEDATAINVVYSARGLWSVGAVWLVGHWFQNKEQSLPPIILRFRLAGAAIMTAAIVVTLMR